MTSSIISTAIRLAVIQRANQLCEYCQKPEIGFYVHEVDHIIAQKHGGLTSLDNLAYACFECNRYKGSDIASLDPSTKRITPLFNPRTQKWGEHFYFQQGLIMPKSPEGRVTVLLLRLNDDLRVQERVALKIGI